MSPHANQSNPSQGSLPDTRYLLSHFISYSNLSFVHCTFLANISTHRKSSSWSGPSFSPLEGSHKIWILNIDRK